MSETYEEPQSEEQRLAVKPIEPAPPGISLDALLAETQRREIRKGFEDNFFFAANEVLRDKGNPDHLPLADVHRELCYWIQQFPPNSATKALALQPRSFLKTELMTIYHSVWRLCKNPNTRILIVNEIDRNAFAMSDMIKWHFRHNRVLRWLYPEVIPGHWGKQEAWSVNRTARLKDNSVEAIGVGGNASSRHFDIINYDDFFTLEKETTLDVSAKIDKYRTWFLGSKFLLDGPKSDRIVVGTRWHFDDPYQPLINSPEWHVWQRQIETDGIPLWHEKFPMEEIKRMRQEFIDQGMLWLWHAQYYNNPLPTEDAILSGYKTYKGHPPKEADQTIISCDPASSIDPKACYTGNIAFKYTGAREVYVDLAVQERIKTLETVERLFSYSFHYGDTAPICIEENGFKMMVETVNEQSIVRGRPLNIIPVKRPSTQRKPDFIASKIQPFVATGRLYVREDMVALREQLDRFPKCRDFDLLDALANGLKHVPAMSPEYELLSKDDPMRELVNAGEATHSAELWQEELRRERKEGPKPKEYGDPYLGCYF